MFRHCEAVGVARQTPNTKNGELDSAIRYLSETGLSSPCAPFDVATLLNLVFATKNGSKSSRETEVASAAGIPRDSALRASCIPTHKWKPDG